MRLIYFSVPLVLTLGLVGAVAFNTPSFARDFHLSQQSAEQLKSVCETVGGRFSQGKLRYGCGTNCDGGPGTACIVTCEPGKRCFAQVMGGRRPRTVESALKK